MSKSALYFLTEEDGRCRQVVNGVVTSLNKKTPIPSPIGTLDIIIFWERDMLRWATIRNFGLPLGFPLDGALILRNDYYKFNIDRKLFLLIKRYVCTVDDLYYYSFYKQLYKGELDFSTFNDEKGESKVEMNIQEGGLLKLIKAQENTKYFLPFDEDAIDVLMDGVDIQGEYKWFFPERLDGDAIIFPFMSQLPSDGRAPGIIGFDVLDGTSLPGTPIDDSTIDYFLTALNLAYDTVGTFTATVNITSGGSRPRSFTLFIFNTVTNVNTNINLMDGQTGPAGIYTINKEVDVKNGDRFFLGINEYFTEFTLTFRVQSKFVNTTVKGFKEYDAYKKVCLKIGIPEDKIISNLLQQSTLVLTSGDGIRRLQDSGITTSFNDIVKNADVNHFTGVQIKDTVELEGRDNYFVQDSIDPAVELGDSKDLKVSPAIDLMYSSIKVGWQEQASNDVNSINLKIDFNGFHIYTTPIKRVSKEMDLQSPYKAGPLEMENLRENLDGKTTTGGRTDNDVFVLDVVTGANPIQNILLSFIASGNYIVFPASPKIIVGASFSILGTASNNNTYTVTAVEDEGSTQTVHTDITITTSEAAVLAQLTFISGQVYILDRSVIPDSGVPSPTTIFNVRFRPSELLKKHLRWIRSYLYGYDADTVIFDHANRNGDLVVNGETDGRDFPIAAMGQRIFIPDYLEFTTRVPISLQDTLEASPNKSFANEWDNFRYVGFLWKAGLAPNSRQEQVYKLLLTIENDRESLI